MAESQAKKARVQLLADNWVGGKPVPPVGGKYQDVLSPFTNEPIGECWPQWAAARAL
jgi:hypothetical protein